MPKDAARKYKTKNPVRVDFTGAVNDNTEFWRLHRGGREWHVFATVTGHYLPTADGETQSLARWDGRLTLLGVPLADIRQPGTGVLPTAVDFPHEHKVYWGFIADDWTETPEGVTAHINHTGNEFPPDSIYEQ